MAFELDPSKKSGRELRRLARKELAAAREQLLRARPPDEEAIHSARKSVKKVRAILRLIYAAGGEDLDSAEKRLRKVNRTLSCLRDADAMIESAASLHRHHPELFSEHVYARIRR